MAHRRQRLQSVFGAFDLDRSGSIEVSELLELGRARRATGQRTGEWSPDRNRRLVQRLDTDGDGKVSEAEFVRHFSEALPYDESSFERVIEEFLEVARFVQQMHASGAVVSDAAPPHPQQVDQAQEKIIQENYKLHYETQMLKKSLRLHRNVLCVVCVCAFFAWYFSSSQWCSIRGPLI